MEGELISRDVSSEGSVRRVSGDEFTGGGPIRLNSVRRGRGRCEA